MTKVVLYSILFLSIFQFDKSTEISYQLKNEKLVYHLKMKNGKQLSVCIDKDDKYIVYRYGSKNKIELEYPKEKDLSSFQKFEYSEYKRGGGIENSGIELKYLAFTNNGIKYVVYDTYFAEANKLSAGIKVIELQNKITDLKGLIKSRKGNLSDFKDKVKDGDELYD